MKRSYSAGKRSIVVRLAERRERRDTVGNSMRKTKNKSRLTISKPISCPRESIKYIVLLVQMVASTLVLPTPSQSKDFVATLTRIESQSLNLRTLA